jgi:formylglycine-generating enzyme required for sulfatase activity
MRNSHGTTCILTALLLTGMATAAAPAPLPQAQAETARQAWLAATAKAPSPEFLDKFAGVEWTGAVAARDRAQAAMQARDYPQAKARYEEAARLLPQAVAAVIPRDWSVSRRKVTVATPKGPVEKMITYYKNTVGMEFVRIEPGEFVMGVGGTREGAAKLSQRRHGTPISFFCGFPAHKVQITRPFYLGATEVTQRQFRLVLREQPSRFDGDSKPVETIGWASTQKFRRALSGTEGLRYRLPTEAEWEYACRAGTTTPFYTGATITDKQANFTGKGTVPVAGYPPNPWGLYDMTGNVLEWCQDWFHARYYEESPVQDPLRKTIGHDAFDRHSYARRRVLRGGCWFHTAPLLRSGQRHRNGPSGKFYINGFRIVVEVEAMIENRFPDLPPDTDENEFPPPPPAE